MDPVHIALTTRTSQVSMNELQQVAAALQTQATRDFGPLWDVVATVDAFPSDQIPVGYFPLIVHDTIDHPAAAGYHQTEADGTPYALVLYGETWSLTASHECLEILADPFGARKQAGTSLIQGQGDVTFLVEVCGPCQAPDDAYAINGVMVSDFCSPHYFDPVAAPQVRRSFSGRITQPLQLLPGGCLSWFADDGLLHQARADSTGTISFRSVAASDRAGRPLREFVDSLAPDHQRRLSRAPRSCVLAAARMRAQAAREAHSAGFRADIARRFEQRPP